jgi:hypothetical protein
MLLARPRRQRRHRCLERPLDVVAERAPGFLADVALRRLAAKRPQLRRTDTRLRQVLLEQQFFRRQPRGIRLVRRHPPNAIADSARSSMWTSRSLRTPRKSGKT